MTTSSTAEFWSWVDREREQRRLSFRAIEGMVGKPSGRLHKRASALQPPTLDGCRAIAEAFGVPLETVLRRANLLPQVSDRPELRELYDYAEALTPENAAIVAAVARALAHEQARLADANGYFHVVGVPELPERPYSARDFLRFLRELSPEERASLVDALGAGEAGPGDEALPEEPAPVDDASAGGA